MRGRHAVGSIFEGKFFRHCKFQPQIRMHKTLAANNALLDVIAKGKPVNNLQMPVAALRQRCARCSASRNCIGLKSRRLRARARHAFIRRRMRGQPRWRTSAPVAHITRIAAQCREEVGLCLRQITSPTQNPNTDIVSFIFLRPAISGQNRRTAEIYQITGDIWVNASSAGQNGTQHAAHNRRAHCRRMPTRTVARCHMAYFMADNAGKFSLRICQREKPAGHISIAAGQGKGVDHGRVEHRDLKLLVGLVGSARDFLHNGLDIIVDPFIAIGTAIGLHDFGVLFGPDSGFVGLAQQRRIGPASCQ